MCAPRLQLLDLAECNCSSALRIVRAISRTAPIHTLDLSSTAARKDSDELSAALRQLLIDHTGQIKSLQLFGVNPWGSASAARAALHEFMAPNGELYGEKF